MEIQNPNPSIITPNPQIQQNPPAVSQPLPTAPPQQSVPSAPSAPPRKPFGESFIFFYDSKSSLIIRLGLAFVFLYAAIFVSGSEIVGAKYVPDFVTDIIPLNIFLSIFSVYEIILALWLLSGRFVKYSGVLVALTLVGITALNMEYFSTVFRNVAIIAAALALCALPKNQTKP